MSSLWIVQKPFRCIVQACSIMCSEIVCSHFCRLLLLFDDASQKNQWFVRSRYKLSQDVMNDCKSRNCSIFIQNELFQLNVHLRRWNELSETVRLIFQDVQLIVLNGFQWICPTTFNIQSKRFCCNKRLQWSFHETFNEFWTTFDDCRRTFFV